MPAKNAFRVFLKLSFLGACRQVGRSMFQADAGKVKVLLDSGTTTFKGERFPLPPVGKIDAAIITHAHLDHSGYVPVHYSKHSIPWYCTYPSVPLINLLWHDAIKVMQQRGEAPYLSEKLIRQANKHSVPMPYGEEYEFFEGTTFSFHDAGHIPGSAQVVLQEGTAGGKTLLYTGDFNATDTRVLSGAKPPVKSPDGLILESTYALRDHPPRKQIEGEFMDFVHEATEEGNALVPCFAIGRTLELLAVLRANNFSSRVYVDGMGVGASQLAMEFPSYLRDSSGLSSALQAMKTVEGNSHRKKIAASKGNVIISTAGMLDGGPALTYLRVMNEEGRGAVLMTGFQVVGTNGRKLVETGRIKDNGREVKINLPVRTFDFSAHAGRTELFDFVKAVSPEKVFCVHGDEEACTGFAAELNEKGFDAVAPKAGEAFQI